MIKACRITLFCLVATVLAGCGQGSQGPQGPAGSSGLIVSSETTCRKFDAGSGTAVTYNYWYVSYTDGESQVFCSVSNGVGTYSASNFYRSTVPGSSTKNCLVTMSLNGSTGGYWQFELQSGTNAVTYVDSGQPHDHYSYTFQNSDCSTN